MSGNALHFLRISIGVIYLWFGMLKFFSGLSPAEELAEKTLAIISFGLIEANYLLFALAFWECTIGVFFLINKQMKYILGLMFLHMIGTLTPFFFFPDLTFTEFPYALTLEGQYIIKNFALITGAMILFVSLEEQKEAKAVEEPKTTNKKKTQPNLMLDSIDK